ncbi:bifunctional diaminohydroxyphosphoribosylaminopyrimidine deaminase/5-amino-6-(5-phosphoribosylamino)uracil reductase RibD [Joostella sp. CR20]|uniref:bifunctional diaminohydroxyphosphoribosylaminopyrimidine deaminase/5-amino-6-(5-phosphoribosylamino)uracil reductase RibD n=1 Tax=Joostella sp. CR20 TaxID=2804312 RepID=UPI00313CCAFD
MNTHEHYIKRALQLAKNGLGNTYPNPTVGCVIVADNKIIGEGYTSPAGQNHAEVNAISAVKDVSLLKTATIYVTLEPCSHFGKTPPCADLIIKHQIPNVVIGTLDTHDKVCGRGVQKLMEAGCNVTVGVLEEECKESNKRFFTFQEKKRPYIILKWAESADGFMSPEKKETRTPVWITNTLSRQIVHKWRTEEHAILVGTTTVLADNPKLNSRDWNGNNPVRIVIDSQLKTPQQSHVLDDSQKTIFIVDTATQVPNSEFKNTFFEEIDFSNAIAPQIMSVLHKHQIQSIIIEGGSKTLQTFIDSNLWDEARVFKGDAVFSSGTKSPIINKSFFYSEEKIVQNTLTLYINSNNA